MHSMFKRETKPQERFCRVRFLRPTNAIDYFTGESIPVEPGDVIDISESDTPLCRDAGFCVVLTRPEMPSK